MPVKESQPERRVRMGDLAGQYRRLKKDIDRAISGVLAGGHFILGPEVARLESEIALLCGVRHGIAVNSGTDALLLSLLALGVGPGDEVITSPFTFFATAETISLTGATPVFVDIERATYNIDAAAVESAVTPRTKAILPVHLYGLPAAMPALMRVARKHKLAVVEDAAQAIGALCQGRPCGSMGDLGAFSFYPTKNLGAFGDGGMVVTNDDALAEQVRLLRAHGSGGTYFYKRLGYCSRLDELQAAIIRAKLRFLPGLNETRRQHAAAYGLKLPRSLATPVETAGDYHIYHQYTVRSSRRDELKQFLAARGIDSGVYYPLPLHLQEVYSSLGYREGQLPESEAASRDVLSLPIHPGLTGRDINYVARNVKEFVSTETGARGGAK
jgi:dTDP-4-amino-4,6-dideoxygalactose transaminase